MDQGLIATWIGLGLTVLAGVVAIVRQSIEVSNRFVLLEAENKGVMRELDELKTHNAKQHEELYTSRNNMSDALTRLSTIMENMAKQQESMDSKLDRLLDRGGK